MSRWAQHELESRSATPERASLTETGTMEYQDEFVSPEEHYQLLVNQLPEDVRRVYDRTRHGRIETGFVGRSFVLYKMQDAELVELDTIQVEQFDMDDETGGRFVLYSRATGREMEVTHKPAQLWEHPVFMALPLHPKLRMSLKRGDPKPSLAFPIFIRTLSRFHLRETGVVHCETGAMFSREFVEQV